MTDMTAESLPDDQLIALTLRHLDLPEGEYLSTLNRFLAWYYFDAKRPDVYLKSLITRHNKRLLS